MSTSPCVLPDTLNIDGTEMNVEGNFGITLFWDHLRPLERLLSSMLRERMDDQRLLVLAFVLACVLWHSNEDTDKLKWK